MIRDQTAAAPTAGGCLRIHYHRPTGDYDNWTVYSWNGSAELNNFDQGPTRPTAIDEYGAAFDIELTPHASDVDFIIHNLATGMKDPGPDMRAGVQTEREVWVISGDASVYTTRPTPLQLLAAGCSRLQAYWIDRRTLAIQAKYVQPHWRYLLTYSATGDMRISAAGALENVETIALTAAGGGLTEAQARQHPQVAGYGTLQVPAEVSESRLAEALKSQLAVAAVDPAGVVEYLTGVQAAGVLDDLFPYSGQLGTSFGDKEIAIRVWTPTARCVRLLLYATAEETNAATAIAMTEDGGVWTAVIDSSYEGVYYMFEITVYVPHLRQMVVNVVTDPYSADLALNGSKTRITNLRSDRNKPHGWDAHGVPTLRSKNDLSIYELHIRDFSIADQTVAAEYRGTYLAFTTPETDGMRHLRGLAEAGLKAIHLLPSFQFSSVDEDKSTWQSTGDLSIYAADSPEQQAAVSAIQGTDGYNWGYDPVHYLAPSGAYAHDPIARVREYRHMVMSLHEAGLRVIQDQVFNHTVANSQNKNSVLDKIVPGYYYRLDGDGNVYATSCCPNTASEHKMMEKLMVDAVVQNAREYKIDGFRFDLMSFHFVSNMQRIQDAVSALTPERDGVDGSKIYLYGEGWNFGETANNALGLNANQVNMHGTGIGVFNDRIRDGIRGGGPFSDVRAQGFATGLLTDPSLNTSQTQSFWEQRAQLVSQSDWIRTGLAGNLRDFVFEDGTGQTVAASRISYGGSGAGYTGAPIENVNFCSVHDNRTLFDAVQLKAPIPGTVPGGGNDTATRARRQVLAMSLIALGQGIPFFMAGDEILRSKDMDNNSFESGDWFNKMDWTYQSANWGIGLPLANQNEALWPIMQPLLQNPALTPTRENMLHARAAFCDFLRIRESSRLFRMETLAEVQSNLNFLNTGMRQIPGLILMVLDGCGADYGMYRHVVVVFNGARTTIVFESGELKGLGLQLHPVQESGQDEIVRESWVDGVNGRVSVPGLTTAVFVSEATS